MNKYEITVNEHTSVSYTIEAHSYKEAKKLFTEWVNKNLELVAGDLLNCSCEWEFSMPAQIDSYTVPDIPYEELKLLFEEQE